MVEDAIWSDWDPFRQVLKVAFVGEGGVMQVCLNRSAQFSLARP